MASNTQNLNLYKADPVADANDTFNIDTLVNDNWDKIDQKAGEQENRLTVMENEVQQPEYSGVLTQNKPVFSVGTGYDEQGKYVDVGETVVKGQVSDLKLEGNTYINFVKNGNFVNGDNWTPIAGVETINNNTNTTTGDGTAANIRVFQQSNLNWTANKKVFARARIRVTNPDSTGMNISLRSGSYLGSVVGFSDQTFPDENVWYTLSFIATNTTFTEAITFQAIANYADAATANGKALEIQEVLTIDLDQHPELQSLTASQINARIPHWFDGAKSTNSIRVKSINANKIDGLEINTFDLFSRISPSYRNETLTIPQTPSATGHMYKKNLIPVNGGENWHLRGEFTGITSRFLIRILDENMNIITTGLPDYNSFYQGFVLNEGVKTLPANSKWVRFGVASTSLADYTVKNMHFVKSDTEVSYVKHDFSEAYVSIPFNDGELTRLLNGSVDSVDLNSGIATQRNKKYVLQSADVVSMVTTYTNLDYAVIPKFDDFAGKGNPLPYNHILGLYPSIENLHGAWDTTDMIGKITSAAHLNNWWVGFTKGTSLATAQSNLVGTTLIYQLAQEQEYNMNTTSLTCYPNGTIMVEPWSRTALKEGNIISLEGHTNVDTVVIRPSNLASGTDNVDNKVALIPYSETDYPYNDTTKENKFYHILDYIRLIVPKGTYANLAAAQADLTGTVVQYATDPSQTTLPTISYNSPTNAAAQRDSNTNAIAQLSDIVAEHDLIVAGQKNAVQQPEYSGGLTQNKPVFSVGTGYDEQGKYVDVGETVVKGQVSVGVMGRTYTNLLGDYSNFKTDSNVDGVADGWSQVNSTIREIVDYSAYKSQKLKGCNSTLFYITHNNESAYKPDKYYICHALVKVNNNENLTNIKVIPNGQGVYNETRIEKNSDISSIGIWQNTGAKFKTVSNPTVGYAPFIAIGYVSAPSSNVEFEVAKYIVKEISLDEYNNLTVDELITKYPYVDSTKSTNSVRIKSESQNRFNKNTATLGYDLNQLNGEVAIRVDRFVSDYIKVKDGMQITLYKPIRFVKYDLNKQYVSGALYGAVGNQTISITDDGYIRFSQFISDIDLAFANNGTLTTFTKHEFSEMYINLPEGVDGLHSLPNGTKDEVKDGKLYKRVSNPYAIQGSDFAELITGINVDKVRTNANFFSDSATWANSIEGKVDVYGRNEKDPIAWDTVGNEGGFTATSTGRIEIIITKGQYLDIATAQSNILSDYNLTSLIYQLAQEQEYNMNTTSLTCYPNGTIMVEPWDLMVLQSTDIHSIDTTTFTNVDIVRTRELIGYAGGQSGISGNYILGLYPEIAESNIDSLNNVGKSYNVLGSAKLRFVVAKGTYANLAAARADLAGTVVQYATDPSQTTLPTISYKAPINAAAQRDSNTNAIAQNARILTNHMTKQNAVNLSFDFRITALEP